MCIRDSSYPVTFYVKYNGFLGILSAVDNELFFASKSTNTGEYVEYFKTIFYQTFAEKTINKIKEKIKMCIRDSNMRHKTNSLHLMYLM